MGSLFRRKQTRPIPESAKVVRRKGSLYATWPGRRGAEIESVVKVHPDGRKTVTVASPVWYAKYVDVDGREITVSTKCRDRSKAERVLKNLEDEQERIRAGVVSREEHDRSKLAASPLLDHIGDFHRSHAASARHRKETLRYLTKLADDLGWLMLGDMKRSSFESWVNGQARDGVGPRTRNGYQTALITFANWLERDGRIAKNPFARLKKANEEADRRRPRRPYTEDEYRALIASTRLAPQRRPAKGDEKRSRVRLTAAERSDLYAVLVGTGIRVGEFRQLTYAYVTLEGEHPRIEIPESIAKTGYSRMVPLRPEICQILAARPNSSDPAAKLFDVPGSLNRRLDADLKRAGLTKVDARGRQLDVHAFRKTFGSWMAKAGVNPKVLQAIMGHRDINITFRHYVDAGITDAFEAVSKLPKLTEG